MDLSSLSVEAEKLHNIFLNLFYSAACILLVIGIVTEYFKFYVGGMPSFTVLVGRTAVAAILLVSYKEVSNSIAEVAAEFSQRLGNVNAFHSVLEKAGKTIENVSWGWGSMGDAFIFVVSYLAFFLLHVTVYFFDAAVAYVWMILYVMSPLLIALYILPATSAATSAMYRSLFEVSSWKVVWSILGTLLWSTALHNFDRPDPEKHLITSLTFTIILSLSIVATPIVVRAFLSKGLSGLAGTLTGGAATTLLASAGGIGSLNSLASGSASTATSVPRRLAAMSYRQVRQRLFRNPERTANQMTGFVGEQSSAEFEKKRTPRRRVEASSKSKDKDRPKNT